MKEKIKAEKLADFIFYSDDDLIKKTTAQFKELAPETRFDSSKLKICVISLRLLSYQAMTLFQFNIPMERFLKRLQKLYVTRVNVKNPREILDLLKQLIAEVNGSIGNNSRTLSFAPAKIAATYLGDDVNFPLILGVQGLLVIWIGRNRELFEEMLSKCEVV